ncbi:DnaB-like helicase C-terminal domain-containing protein [Streptomyces sp. H10-C2]|uniref:DnaB-like helicase C-terminal domain-containing protein n=1 Tax=unclassified Streptomyces TaxID=2593676 RepID=UPI0024B94AEB|nr:MULTISPECIES: DnaB-like helicase C-terminal domain-containing protein [unclassified Streptomyces]MDJ0342215.1 DnaB-like helicase C-terminal domain-containing protein [Streptomyces sp. PH10-H1]MDJ0368729.1 DnaB-like helicase C-terminal domain-containing protein [Streptomyces sp. H10-C2]
MTDTNVWDAPLDDAPTEGRFVRPSDVGSERVVAAAVMARPHLIDDLADSFDPVDFTDQRLAWVWHAVDELRAEITEGPVPWPAVDRQLRKWRAEGYLPIVPLDGPHLSLLYDDAHLSCSAAWYADRVTKAAAACRMVDLGIRAQQAGMSPAFDPDADVATTQADLDAIVRGDAGGIPTPIGDLWAAAVERAVTPTTTENRIPTGLLDLDSLTGGGFAPGRLIIIGARPGAGKTTAGQGLARAAAIANGIPTLFSSLEMGREEIMGGILSAECRVPLHHISHGTVGIDDAYRLAVATERIKPAPLYIDDATSVSLPSLRGQIRQLVRTVGLRMVIVDYLQLMQAPRAESRQVAVSALSRGLKLLAKEFGITVIVLSQLNRDSEKRTDKRPTIADLRESGAIEQDADMVILIHRPDLHEPDSPRAGEVDLIVDKHRGGPRATLTAAFQGHYARIADMAQMSDYQPTPINNGGLAIATYDEDPQEREAS